jgi:hypothetical protein
MSQDSARLKVMSSRFKSCYSRFIDFWRAKLIWVVSRHRAQRHCRGGYSDRQFAETVRETRVRHSLPMPFQLNSTPASLIAPLAPPALPLRSLHRRPDRASCLMGCFCAAPHSHSDTRRLGCLSSSGDFSFILFSGLAFRPLIFVFGLYKYLVCSVP